MAEIDGNGYMAVVGDRGGGGFRGPDLCEQLLRSVEDECSALLGADLVRTDLELW